MFSDASFRNDCASCLDSKGTVTMANETRTLEKQEGAGRTQKNLLLSPWSIEILGP